MLMTVSLNKLKKSIILGFRVSVAAMMVALAVPAHAGPDRIALVIGNGGYLHFDRLPNPPNDASQVSKMLKDIGFQVFPYVDLKHDPMSKAIDAFLDYASPARIVVVFYSGHGLQVAGRNYMVPLDAKHVDEDSAKAELIEVDSIILKLSNARHASIVILDACRNDPQSNTPDSSSDGSKSVANRKGLAPYSPPVADNSEQGTGVLIAFSTAPGKVALDGDGANSPFTTALLKHLKTPGLEIRQALTRVRAEVADKTGNKQIPWDNSSLFGDVYLVPQAPQKPRDRGHLTEGRGQSNQNDNERRSQIGGAGVAGGF